MALALDGSVYVDAYTSVPPLVTPTLTCSNAGNVIVVTILTNGGPILSVVGTGATFTQFAATGGSDIEVWLGYASGTFSSTLTVTTTTAGSFMSVRAFGVNGCPSSSYTDGSANTGASDPRTLTTSAANTFVVGTFRMGSTAGPTAGNIGGSAATKIADGGGGYMLTEWAIRSSTMSAGSVTIGTGAGDANGGIAFALVASGGGPVTHATTGAVTGSGSTVAGTASRTRVHDNTGAVTGPGAVVTGTAARTRVHDTNGAPVGPGAVVTGSAARAAAGTHPTSGAVVGPGAVVTGTAAHIAVHATSGAVVGPGAIVAGTAAHIAVHATTGTVVGPGATVTGSAARAGAAVTHNATGAVVGPGALVQGIARNGVMPVVNVSSDGDEKRRKVQREKKKKLRDDVIAAFDTLTSHPVAEVRQEARSIAPTIEEIDDTSEAELLELAARVDDEESAILLLH